jgi:hypothetical protein
MILRKTSAYLIRIQTTDPRGLLEKMIEQCPVDVEQTAHVPGTAGLRFRCPSDDNQALNIALQIAGGRTFSLYTGYGVNQREIAQ